MSALVQCEHVPSPNPRHDSCAKCGRPMDSTVIVAEQPEARVRNEDWEAAFLGELTREARRQGVVADGFSEAVQARLAMGEARYGTEFMRRDLIREGQEEVWDLAAYVILELQKRMTAGQHSDAYETEHLFRAAVHGAIADSYLRRAYGDED